jgi:8-oxo-dGTP pyrophosphatase MutT (NUDIX family)
MPKKQAVPSTAQEKVNTMDQISAGGVALRWTDSKPQVAIVSVKPKLRWQLPKGIVDPGESPQVAAVREVREEAGVETAPIKLIETIEYWYRSVKYGKPVRYHKFVHFYLMEYKGGDVADHDHEVEEARWVSFDEALQMLDFKSERDVLEKAREMVEEMGKTQAGKSEK